MTTKDDAHETPPEADATAAGPSVPATSRGPDATSPGARGFALALLSVAVLLGMSGWFAATSVAPLLEARWDLETSQLSLLTTLVQIGFVAGTLAAAILNLADVLPLRAYFGLSALLAAATNGALLLVDGFAAAAVLRFLTGVFLAGVYPPAMKMVATWFFSARGFAIGTVVGALTLGKAAPYLVKGVGSATVEAVVWATTLGGALGGIAVLLLYRDGPYPFARRPFAWSRVTELLRHRPTMLATGGYLGHMWELYAFWALVYLWNASVFESPDLVTWAMIASGAIGCVWGGRLADALGRVRVANGSMAISGACCLVAGWIMEWPFLVLAVGLVWGVTVVADSAQFSALVTEVAPSHAVGTALTLQTMLGFTLTGVSIEVATRVHAAAGWVAAWSLLAIGPVLGILSMRALRGYTSGRAGMEIR